MPETAEPVVIDECRRCDARPARGNEWVENQLVYFKCDECGSTLHQGVLEELNREQLEKKTGSERANQNRERFLREWGEKMQSDFRRNTEDLSKDAYQDAEDSAGLVWQKILPS